MTSILGPRNLGGILGETFRIYKRNFLRLLAIVAVVQVINMSALLFSFAVLFPVLMAQGKIESVTPFLLNVIIFLLCIIVAFPLMEGALIHAVSEQYLSRPIGIGRAYRFAWERLGALIGAMFLGFLGLAGVIMISYFMASINLPGARYIFVPVGFCAVIYLMVRWIFVWQGALLEGLGPIAALSRSSDLVNGNWWRVLGIMVVVGIITTAIGAILWKIPEVGEIIGSVLSIPIFAIGGTLLYYDLRVRKEGYSLESLAGELHIKIEADRLDLTVPTKAGRPQRKWLVFIGIPTILLLAVGGAVFWPYLHRGVAEVDNMAPWPSVSVATRQIVNPDLNHMGLQLAEVIDASSEEKWRGAAGKGSVAKYLRGTEIVAMISVLKYPDPEILEEDWDVILNNAKELRGNLSYIHNDIANKGVISFHSENVSQKMFRNGRWLVDIAVAPNVNVNQVRDGLVNYWHSKSSDKAK
jgi:hypothetical protein